MCVYPQIMNRRGCQSTVSSSSNKSTDGISASHWDVQTNHRIGEKLSHGVEQKGGFKMAEINFGKG